MPAMVWIFLGGYLLMSVIVVAAILSIPLSDGEEASRADLWE